jgi:hydroxymethylbilane synthase
MERGPLPGYPISFELTGRRAVVVGGGRVAERRVAGLLGAGARVTVVAREATPGLRRDAEEGRLELLLRPFEERDLERAALALAATDDDGTNGRVVAAARRLGIPVNDAMDPERGDFTLPAVHRTGSVTVAVDTGGLSPSFAKRVRDEVAQVLDERYAGAATTLGRMRAFATEHVGGDRRAAVLARLAAGDVSGLAAMTASEAESAVLRTAAELGAGAGAGSATLLPPLVCASRASALALWQARHTMALLAEHGIASTLLSVSTKGDRELHAPLAELGGDGVFVKELEAALRERRADYAVHSCKDLPSTLTAGMVLAAVGAREDPRDAFCSERYASFEDLPPGAVVGTSSPRRRAQLQALRADLRYEDLRGNIDTRLRKLREGSYDAIVLAMAGLTRLGLRAAHTVPFAPDQLVPAAGQGALAVECRAEDAGLAARLSAAVTDPATSAAVSAERALMRELGAGCQAPVGAHAWTKDGTLTLSAVVLSPDGALTVRAQADAPLRSAADAEHLGRAVAVQLLEAGAGALLLPGDRPLAGRVFLLPRTRERESRIAPALRAAGAEVLEARDGDEASSLLADRIPDVLLFPSSGSVAAVGEYLDALRLRGSRPLVAAMGESSAAAAAARGFPVDIVAPEPVVGAFVHSITHYVLRRL